MGINDVPALMVVGLLVFFGGLVAAIVGTRVVYAQKITKDEARVRGVGEAYLASLPTYPRPR